MPRGFSDSQMQRLRDRLIASALDALKHTGVRKTRVEDLAKAAGLSTGAFYKFFPSKEALFFAVYDLTEERLKAEFTAMLRASAEVSAATLRMALKQLIRSEAMQTLLRLMQKEELDYMLLNLDPALVEGHLEKDYRFLREVSADLEARGVQVIPEPRVLLDYLQALFVLCYARDQYAQNADRIIDAFIDTLVTESTRSC